MTVAAIPDTQNGTVAAIMRHYEATVDTSHRPHLGASLIGHACERSLWLTFRWALSERLDGRKLRLFAYGQQAEPRLNAELRAIGVEVHDVGEDGKQFRVEAVGGHFGGSMDGAGLGFPEAPKTWHVIEEKTHNAKSFKELTKKGVQSAKPMHYDQMQTYMCLTGMDRAFYLAECKDDSSLYTERIEADPVAFARIMAKAERIITSATPPAKLSESAEYFECKWCKFAPICHGTTAPEVNCRTCANSTPDIGRGNATWTCTAGTDKPLVTIPIHHQRIGCEHHLYIPPMLERIGTPVDGDEQRVKYLMPDGAHFTNGPRPGLSSAEIFAAVDKAILGHMCTDVDLVALRNDLPESAVVA